MVDVRIHDLTNTATMLSSHQLEIDIGNGTSSGKVTGTVLRTFVLTGFTASRAVEIDGSGNLIASSITAAELAHLAGVTSALQTQIDGKVGTGRTLTAGVGLVGGGTLAADRTFDLDLNDLTTDTPVATDTLAFYDVSGSDTNKATINDILGVRTVTAGTGLSGGGVLSADITINLDVNDLTSDTPLMTDTVPFYDVSGTDTNKVTISNFTRVQYRPNVEVTGTVTLSTTHENAFLYCTNGSTATLTIPPNSTTAFDVGTEIEVWRSNASVAIVEGSGVTLNGHDGTNAVTTTATIGTQHTGCCIKKVATDTWVVLGRFTSS